MFLSEEVLRPQDHLGFPFPMLQDPFQNGVTRIVPGVLRGPVNLPRPFLTLLLSFLSPQVVP